MIKEPSKVTMKASWKIESPLIHKANAFRCVYTPQSTVLYIGLVDPEDMLIASQKIPKKESTNKKSKITEVNTLARYCLDHHELIRLKKEIDQTVNNLKKIGALKNAP